jgi:hypothetical protein
MTPSPAGMVIISRGKRRKIIPMSDDQRSATDSEKCPDSTGDKPEDEDAVFRKKQEEAIRQADEAAKRFKERLDRMNKETNDLLKKIDEL